MIEVLEELLKVVALLGQEVNLEDLAKFICEWYPDERGDESSAQVVSTLQTPRGGEITINYMLHRLQSGWKIYDLIVEDVSVVKNYRAQFSRVISKSSYEELVHRIEQKLSEFDSELAMAD